MAQFDYHNWLDTFDITEQDWADYFTKKAWTNKCTQAGMIGFLVGFVILGILLVVMLKSGAVLGILIMVVMSLVALLTSMWWFAKHRYDKPECYSPASNAPAS